MERADVYFMEHLHLMINKPNLVRMNGNDGQSFADSQSLKKIKQLTPEKVNDTEIETMIERMRQMFRTFAGGSLTVEQIKQRIQERVKQIKPRYSLKQIN
jgi:ribosome-binding ATPase YchF (GTP1/OBG family)